ncbi:MAG: dephospho-CoA kinase [Eubacteriales bacterium]|nr:dephospho-CoA kinase [Eubacteriales bacterium]MDD3350160.1 dephospho-CoA kinase [Eubacteriales bacterium]
MKRIGLTGGIGSGKSTVSRYLMEKGYPVLDADEIAKELLSAGSETLMELKEAFGEKTLLPDGTLDRKYVADLVFSDSSKKAILDKITHGKVLEEILLRASRLGEDAIVFIDAALLFEAGIDKYVDETWVVDAGDDVRIQRVMDRDGLSKAEIQKRINNQMNRRDRLKKANYVLDNSGSKESIYGQVNKLLEHLQE